VETINQRLERLYLTDNWDPNDKEWLSEYLKGDISELYLIALEGFSKDVLENKLALSQTKSAEILNNIHQLIQPSKQVFPFRAIVKLAVAASVAGICYTGYLFRKQLDNWIDPVKYEVAETKGGELKMVQLADATTILLNADSRITYPDHFKGNKREVTLMGEAYFNVAHDKNKPFIVHSGKITTSVLGTSFNVKAYKDDETIKVTVVTGKVGVIAHGNAEKGRTVLLTPDMQAVFTKTSGNLLSSAIGDVSLVTCWGQGKLQYRNAPLTEVLADLQRKYNVVIKADNNLLNCKLYADFNNLPLQKVLKIMGVLINAHAAKDGNGYRLKGKGCN
jgi:ferric-dicitrate binding protein FerR (iron transport regulator)